MEEGKDDAAGLVAKARILAIVGHSKSGEGVSKANSGAIAEIIAVIAHQRFPDQRVEAEAKDVGVGVDRVPKNEIVGDGKLCVCADSGDDELGGTGAGVAEVVVAEAESAEAASGFDCARARKASGEAC